MNEKNTNEKGSVWAVVAAFAVGLIAGIFISSKKKGVVADNADAPYEEISGEEYEDLWDLQDEEEGISDATTEEITEETSSYSF